MQDLLSIETSNYSICHQDVVEMKFKEKKKNQIKCNTFKIVCYVTTILQ